jgi:hypothetical protein
MKTMTKGTLSTALLAAIFAVGCGSSGDTNDGQVTDSAVTDAGDAGPTLYGISEGDSCFEIVTVEPGSSDGCNIGVADPVTGPNGGLVGASILVNYVRVPSATLTVGKSGALGAGTITYNMGTLTRENNPALEGTPACTWHQKDTSTITVTATNEFNLAGVEVQDMFATACAATDVPPGGMCTSSWTWHMKKSTKTPPGCN